MIHETTRDFRIRYNLSQSGLNRTRMEAALEICTVEKYPVNYAQIQNNLGTAYSTLAEVREKEENAKRAIRAYEAALGIYTIEKYPVYYAQTQNNLEIAYGILAENRNRS